MDGLGVGLSGGGSGGGRSLLRCLRPLALNWSVNREKSLDKEHWKERLAKVCEKLVRCEGKEWEKEKERQVLGIEAESGSERRKTE